MTSAQMVERVKYRTKYPNDPVILGELNSAKDWAYSKIYNSENGPDLLMTFGTEKTMSTQTREYDLGANITGTLYGIKKLWLRFSNEVNFTPMQPCDSADIKFIFNDQWPSSDTTTVAQGHPVLYDVVNFSKLRFSPPLPANAVIRADVWLCALDVDPVTNNTLTYGADIPQPAHEAVVDKATAHVFNISDDSRWLEWEQLAERRMAEALYVMTRRVQSPVSTQPFRIRRKRWI